MKALYLLAAAFLLTTPVEASPPPSILLSAKVVKRGVKRDYVTGSASRSYVRDETRTMALQIDVQSRGKEDEEFEVLWCTVVRDLETKEILPGDGEISTVPIEAGKGVSWRTGESSVYATKERWKYLDEKAAEGERVIGWLVAVYHKGELIATHTSTNEARKFAAAPAKMRATYQVFTKLEKGPKP